MLMQPSHLADSGPSRMGYSLVLVFLLAGGFAVAAWFSVDHVNTQWDEQHDQTAARALVEHPLTGSGIDGSQARLPMYVTALMYKLFGESLQLARLISIICGAAAIVLTYCAGRRWFSNNVGLLAAGLLAVSPYFICYSRYSLTESDAFCPLTVLLMLLVFDAYVRRRDSKYLVIFSLTLGLALAAKFYTVLLIPALAICDLLYYRAQILADTADAQGRLSYDPKKHRPMLMWALIMALLIFLTGSATQLGLTRPATGLWAATVLVLLFGLRELVPIVGRGKLIIRDAGRWPPIIGWVVILLLAGTFCLAAFPEHVLNSEVPRALFRRLLRQDHTLPMVEFADPARLYLGITLFKLGLPLGLLTIAALIWSWIRSTRDSILRLLTATVVLYILLLLTLPVRQTFYLMMIYPLLMLILSAFIVWVAVMLAGRESGQSGWIALVITACLWSLWGDFRSWPNPGQILAESRALRLRDHRQPLAGGRIARLP